MDDLNTILLWRLCRRAGAPSLSALLFALEGGDSASLKPDRPMPFINLWQAAVPLPVPPGDPPPTFRGVIRRIPADEVARLPHVSAEAREPMIREWNEGPESFERHLKKHRWAIAPDGTSEQIEAFDIETGDLLVLWRAPSVRSNSRLLFQVSLGSSLTLIRTEHTSNT